MIIKHTRALTRGGLLLLMFALGITLVALWRSRPAPPPPAAPAPAAALTGPETPSEVVTAYWRLALEGDIEGAQRYWARDIPKGQTISHARDHGDWGWSTVISMRQLRLVGIEREVAEADGSVSVITRAIPDGAAPVTFYSRNRVKKIDGEWKLVGFNLKGGR